MIKFLFFLQLLSLSVYASEDEPALVAWENSGVSLNLDGYHETYPISFVGLNNSNQPLKIKSVRPDCSSCINLRPSSENIPPGGRIEISGDVIIETVKERKFGRLAVVYEGHESPDILSYDIQYPSCFSLDPRSLIWLDDRLPKTFSLKVNSSLGLSLGDFRVETDDISVVIKDRSPDLIVFEVTPNVKDRLRDFVYFTFKYVNPDNPTEERLLKDALFLTISLEEREKN